MPPEQLTDADVQLARACLDLVARTSLLDDGELQTLVGFDRVELLQLDAEIASARQLTSKDHFGAAINAAVNLRGYPFDAHERKQIATRLGADYLAVLDRLIARLEAALRSRPGQ